MKLKKNEYQCALCKGVFEKGWSDEEAMKEAQRLWGDISTEEKAVICDECFNRLSPSRREELGGEYKSASQDAPG